MDRAFAGDNLSGRARRLTSRGRCAICAQRPSNRMQVLEESLSVSGARLSWLLCARCAAAVEAETQRSNLRTPFRTRIAVAIVASERGSKADVKIWDEAYWANLSDEQWNKLVIAWIVAVFIMAPTVFLAITILASALR
jgi:hypothetical protein